MSNIVKHDNSNAQVHSLQKQIDGLFHNFFSDFDLNLPKSSGLVKTFQPRVNISEDEQFYYVDAELAGVKKEDVKLEYHDDNTLTISAEKREEKCDDKKNYHRIESNYGSFFRSFYLPDNVDRKAIEAEMLNGVLKVCLPKAAKPETKGSQINIK